MILKKRQLLMATLVLALAAAVFVNWYYTRPGAAASANKQVPAQAGEEEGVNLGDARYVIASDVSVEEKAESDYFAAARLRRRTAHDEAAEALNDVIKDGESDADAVRTATDQLNALAEDLVLEGDLENLITAKLQCDCLVVINDSVAEVIVPHGVADAAKVVKIREVCVNHADCSADQVTVTELTE